MPFALLTATVATLFCIVLGAFAFFKNPDKAANRCFAFFNLSLAVWIPSDFIKHVANHHTALLLYRLCYAGGSFMPFTFLMFVWEVTGFRNNRLYATAKWLAIISALLLQTPFVILDIQLNQGSPNPIKELPGPLYWIFWVFIFLSLIPSLASLIFTYRGSSGTKRKQLQYMRLSFVLGLIALLNFLGSQVTSKIPPLFYLLIMAVSGTFAIAIMKHRLMDITLIVRNTLLYSILTAILTAIYVVALNILLFLLRNWAGLANIYSSATAAGVIAIMFHPLLRHLQGWIDRYFPRASLSPALLREATSDFVHEIKKPLSNISIPAQLALEKVKHLNVAPEDRLTINAVQKHLEYIVREARDAADLIEAIRSLSLSDGVQHGHVDLETVVSHILQRESTRLKKYRINVATDFDSDMAVIHGDEKQLEVAISNVIRNAIDALTQTNLNCPRKIEVILTRNKNHLFLKIRDSGPGIKEARLSRLFDPWFTTKGESGMGIGLFLTRELLSRHDASIHVESVEGSGASFEIRFPVA